MDLVWSIEIFAVIWIGAMAPTQTDERQKNKNKTTKSNKPINLFRTHSMATMQSVCVMSTKDEMAHHKFITTNSFDWIRRDVCQSK